MYSNTWMSLSFTDYLFDKLMNIVHELMFLSQIYIVAADQAMYDSFVSHLSQRNGGKSRCFPRQL